jgi:hypothetical protein
MRILTRGGRFMKGRDLLRSALRETAEERADCCAGANAEADADKRATRAAVDFIMVAALYCFIASDERDKLLAARSRGLQLAR